MKFVNLTNANKLYVHMEESKYDHCYYSELKYHYFALGPRNL